MEKIKRGKAGGRFKFEWSFKRMVMAELCSGSITKAELQRKYSISAGSVERWLRWYQQEQAGLLPSSLMNETTQEQQGTPEPEADIVALQEELRLTKLKLTCLETMIDMTEQELGIDIRKNAGTRSSAE